MPDSYQVHNKLLLNKNDVQDQTNNNNKEKTERDKQLEMRSRDGNY